MYQIKANLNGKLGACASIVYRSWAAAQETTIEKFVTDSGVPYWYDRRTQETYWEKPLVVEDDEKNPANGEIVESASEMASLGVGIKKAPYEQTTLRSYLLQQGETSEDEKSRFTSLEKSAKKHGIQVKKPEVERLAIKDADNSMRGDGLASPGPLQIQSGAPFVNIPKIPIQSGRIADLKDDAEAGFSRPQTRDTRTPHFENSSSVRRPAESMKMSMSQSQQPFRGGGAGGGFVGGGSEMRDSPSPTPTPVFRRPMASASEHGAGPSTAAFQDVQINQLIQNMSAAISNLTSQAGMQGIKSDDLLRLGMGIGMGLGLNSAATTGGGGGLGGGGGGGGGTFGSTAGGGRGGDWNDTDGFAPGTPFGQSQSAGLNRRPLSSAGSTRVLRATQAQGGGGGGGDARHREQDLLDIRPDTAASSVDMHFEPTPSPAAVTTHEQTAAEKKAHRGVGVDYTMHQPAGEGVTFEPSASKAAFVSVTEALRYSKPVLPNDFLSSITDTHVGGQVVNYLPDLPNLNEASSVGVIKPRTAAEDWFAIGYDPWSAGKEPLMVEFISSLEENVGGEDAAFLDADGLKLQHEEQEKANANAALMDKLVTWVRHGKYAEIEVAMVNPNHSLQSTMNTNIMPFIHNPSLRINPSTTYLSTRKKKTATLFSTWLRKTATNVLQSSVCARVCNEAPRVSLFNLLLSALKKA
jgi:hypothetical protein